MQVSIIDCEQRDRMAGETLTFRLSGVDNSFANGLRRVLLAEVPTLGIEAVTISQNTSVLPDEMIAHRLGLVPLFSMKARHMNYARECPCGGSGCELCRITGELNVECPPDRHSLQVFINESLRIHDPDVYPVSAEKNGIWLVTLGRSQKLSLKIDIRKNIAKTHAKFMPVATVAMQYAPEVKLNQRSFAALDAKECAKWVARCPRNVFQCEELTNKVTVRDASACIFCRECTAHDAVFDKLPEPLVFVRPKKDRKGYYEFTFVVESTGVLPVLQLLYDAVEVLRKKLQRIRIGLSEDPNADENVQTRTIGGATTAPVVVNQDALGNEGAEDNLNFIMK